jgi:lysyl-tRNA synthetase class 1
MGVLLPTLGAERQATYSPFLPISPKTGRVLYVPMKNVDPKAGTVTFDDEDGTETTLPVTGGHCKLQWKPDFGMRWYALGVDFEMFGKDHQTNQAVYDRICAILGGNPPEHYVYELFLDDLGQKISKSKGNGLTIDEWLAYASPESLALYMFQKPRVAKRLYFDVIPRAVDEYYQFVAAYHGQAAGEQLENPAFHIHTGHPPRLDMPVTFGLLLNLASAANAHEPSVVWSYLSRRLPGETPATNPELDRLVGYAVRYFEDEVRPTKTFRAPTDKERAALADLAAQLQGKDGLGAKELQDIVYAVGNPHQFDPLRDWFGAIYQVLLGADQGPRFGSFVALYGVAETRKLIEDALAGKLLKA